MEDQCRMKRSMASGDRSILGEKLSPQTSEKPTDSALVERQRTAPGTRGHLPLVLKSRRYDPHGLKPIPSRVLLEEDYVSILEAIIQREFFPDLHKLRLQKALMDAQANRDTFGAAKLQNELRFLETVAPKDLCPTKRVQLLDGRELEVKVGELSLREFQTLFTSEDNASFENIVIKEKAKLSREQAWIEAAALGHNEHNAEIIRAIQSGERPAQLVSSNVEARSRLMFPLTDGNIGTMELQRTSDGETVALTLGQFCQGGPPRGEILPENTRLEDGGEQLTRSLHKASLAKQAASETEAAEASLFDEMVERGVYSAIELMRAKRKHPSASSPGIQTPMRISSGGEQYAFVKTPVFKPGENMSPLMTWGTVAATPLVLSGADDQKTPLVVSGDEARFSIPEPSAKEAAAIRLADSAAKKLLEQKAKQTSCLRQILTPLLSTTPSKDLFGTPSRSSLQRLRGTLRTPCITSQPSIKRIRRPPLSQQHTVSADVPALASTRTAAGEGAEATPASQQNVTVSTALSAPSPSSSAPSLTDNLLNF